MAARRKERQDLAQNSVNPAVETLHKVGFKVTSRMVESEIKEGILNVASEWGTNLIVVTSHAHKGVQNFCTAAWLKESCTGRPVLYWS